MRLASCLLASVLTAVAWHASPVNGENYLRSLPRSDGTDVAADAGLSENVLSKSSKAGIASRVSTDDEKVSIDKTHDGILSSLGDVLS
jgi:hypothetical protein